MTLGRLIDILENMDPGAIVEHGFAEAHSWRGVYAEVAFTPASNVTVGSMLESARSALDGSFVGWKGGTYSYGLTTPVHVDYPGEWSDSLGDVLMSIGAAR